MLGEPARDRIEKLIAVSHDRRAACIDAMNIICEHHGHVSDENLEVLAGMLHMSPTELDSVATFYNMVFRKPVGKHVLLVCDSISCWVMGYEGVRAQLERLLGIRVGQTTRDDRFTLLTVPCLGACDRAPALMLDDRLIGPVTEDELESILEACD